jgi:transaldolase
LQDKIKGGSPDAERVLGKCAVANAKLAYQRFKQMSSLPRWHSLERAGARPQRLLWASTSTKNPSYDDLMYVEPLIGAQTVTTLPSKTITAFAHHGNATASLERGIAEAAQVMSDLKRAGIDLPRVTEQLLEEGIDKFSKAHDEILRTIADKAQPSGAR